MKFGIWICGLMVCLLGACSSVEKLDTELKDPQPLGNETVGKRDGVYVVQDKKDLVAHLREVQREVYTMEENIYGNRAWGNKGKYGVLRDCKMQRTPAGEDIEMEPKKLLTAEELNLEIKVGEDEAGQLVTLKEEDLMRRLKRFEGYRAVYEQQEEWFDNEIQSCKQSQVE